MPHMIKFPNRDSLLLFSIQQELNLCQGKILTHVHDSPEKLKNKLCFSIMNKKSCSIYEYDAGMAINSSPAVANGLVYVGSLDHKLYGLPQGLSAPMVLYDGI